MVMLKRYPKAWLPPALAEAYRRWAQLGVHFRGALGGSYHQCKDFLREVSALHWNIVEQSHYVRAGQLEFESESLRVHETVRAASQASPPQVILASSVFSIHARSRRGTEVFCHHGGGIHRHRSHSFCAGRPRAHFDAVRAEFDQRIPCGFSMRHK